MFLSGYLQHKHLMSSHSGWLGIHGSYGYVEACSYMLIHLSNVQSSETMQSCNVHPQRVFYSLAFFTPLYPLQLKIWTCFSVEWILQKWEPQMCKKQNPAFQRETCECCEFTKTPRANHWVKPGTETPPGKRTNVPWKSGWLEDYGP